MKKIEIMGCGYIGLTTAITYTLAGYEVCGFDVKDTVVGPQKAGQIKNEENGIKDAKKKQKFKWNTFPIAKTVI